MKLGRPFIKNDLKTEIPDGYQVTETNKVAPEAITRLYSNHTVGTIRSAGDVRKFLNIPNTRVYCLWDNKNTLKAYAVEGKGLDLDGYIHEWGGNTSALLHLFKGIQEKSKKEVIVITPPHCRNIIRQCSAAGAQR